ncbi:conserved hypothetical protein [Candidatus Sulfopaludibacter sp. SbA3]|nr:conserved hypothetical protein [Candidatus Sulfopaludibacter sp. SbA3]
MTITIEIPEELVRQFVPEGQDPNRAALEPIALEGYRSDRLTVGGVRELLRFDTLMEVDALLKEHGAFLNYTLEDLRQDCEVARQVAERV